MTPIPTARLALAALAFASAGPAAAAEPQPRAVTVTGEGTATATPDIAVVTGGVTVTGQTAGAALKANAAAMTKVLAAAKQAGVEDRDVATAGLNVQPQFDYGDGAAPREPRLLGYEVRNAVTIRFRTADRVGELVDALVAAGANQIDGLAFEVADREVRRDEARRAAVADARRKAELFAGAAGAKLGEVVTIDEDSGADEPAPRAYAIRAKAMDAAPQTPIARGEQEIRARVTARWALQP